MDTDRFDRWTRTLSTTLSRRGMASAPGFGCDVCTRSYRQVPEHGLDGGIQEEIMDAARFDRWSQVLAVSVSRRQSLASLAVGLGALAGRLTLVEAGKRKRCRGSKRRCGKKCIRGTRCCHGRCEVAGDLCAGGTCVIGQGTCATGADSCVAGVQCGGAASPQCACIQTTAGATRCGSNAAVGTACNICVTDADCAAQFPEIPGVVCVRGGSNCFCSTGSTMCMPPCAVH